MASRLALMRLLLRLALGLGLWVYLDLFLRLELPGATPLKSAAFESSAWVIRGLGREERMPALPLLGIGVAAMMLVSSAGRFRRTLVALAVPLAALQVLVLGIAGLMERPMLVGLALAWCVDRLRLRGLALSDSIGSDGSPPAPWGTPARGLVVSAVLLACFVYLNELFTTRAEGYWLLETLGEAARAGVPLHLGFTGFSALLAALMLWRVPESRVPGLVGGVAAGLLALPAGGLEVLSLGLATVAGFSLTVGLSPRLLGSARSRQSTSRGMSPVSWPLALTPWLCAAFIAMTHSYTARVFACDVEHRALTRVARTPEVFRLALGDDALLLSLRTERRLLRLSTSAPMPAPVPLEPGPVPHHPADAVAVSGQTLANLEELVYSPSMSAFIGTALAGHADFYSFEWGPSREHDMFLYRVPGTGDGQDERSGIDALVPLMESCLVGAMSRSTRPGELLLGCEFSPRLIRYGLEPMGPTAIADIPELGDVSSMSLDAERGRLFVSSFWDTGAIARVDPEDLSLEAVTRTSSANVDLAVHQPTGDVLMTSYFDGRVRRFDGASLEQLGTIPVGFGARALGYDQARDLLLVSSVYDGVLRVCSGEDGSMVERLRVGGHVKDIAMDEERGIAWFWSQCGLFKLDLEALRQSPMGAPVSG